jgi:hypothetical protein
MLILKICILRFTRVKSINKTAEAFYIKNDFKILIVTHYAEKVCKITTIFVINKLLLNAVALKTILFIKEFNYFVTPVTLQNK